MLYHMKEFHEFDRVQSYIIAIIQWHSLVRGKPDGSVDSVNLF
jgi:hypothetical protein